MVKKKKKGVESRKSQYGMMFVLPWIIGVIMFFIVPILQSLIFSLSEVFIEADGVVMDFIGVENFRYLISEDPDYLKLLSSSVTQFLYSLPLILIISLVLALILNQKFRGRLFFRSLFFLPVIIASGIVLEVFFDVTSENTAALGVSTSMTANMFSVSDIMTLLDLPQKVATYVQVVITNIFDLVWSCGIQIILFIAGLQSIPGTVYEASKVEGATKWEEFWFITFPMISRVVLLTGIFTMVQLFTDNRNPMISKAYTMMGSGIYDRTSAMLWFYFLIVGVIMILIVGLYSKTLLKKWK